MYTQPFLRVSSSSFTASICPSSRSRSTQYKLVFALSRHRLSTSSRSNATAFPVAATDDSIRTTSSTRAVADVPRDPKPFAIEHVGGREQHLSWSQDGQISKRWREVNADVNEVSSRRSSIPIVSGAVSKMKSWFTTMFLPTNYPQSVHRSYVLHVFSTIPFVLTISQVQTISHTPICRNSLRHPRLCSLQPSASHLSRSQCWGKYIRCSSCPVDHQGRCWRNREIVLHSKILALLR